MALDLDNALLEAEDFDIDDFGTKLGKNLEEIRLNLHISDWHNPMYLPGGMHNFDLFLELFLNITLCKYVISYFQLRIMIYRILLTC